MVAADSRKTEWGRWAALILSVLAGTYLSLCLCQHGTRFLTPALPLALSLASFSVIALSSICVWGLLFTIPMYYLAKAALDGASLWRCCLPVLCLQSAMTSINRSLSGDVAWSNALLAVGVSLALLMLVILLIGPAQARKAVSIKYHAIRSHLADLKAQSEAEEAAARKQAVATKNNDKKVDGVEGGNGEA